MMFSTLRRFSAADASGARSKIVDFAIELLDQDYPPLTKLFVATESGETAWLPWDAVRSLDSARKVVVVDDLAAAEVVSAETLAAEVLLGRDVLDSLVLDLENRRATRANDLWLDGDGRALALRAADTGLRAIFRRLGLHALKRRTDNTTIYDWKYVEFLRGRPDAARSGSGYHLRINRMPAGEIAGLAASIPYLHAAELVTLLPDPLAADVLEASPADRQLQIFEELDPDDAAKILALMAPENVADLAKRLETDAARRHIEALPTVQRDRVLALLRYPDDTVGGMMTNDVLSVPDHATIAEARELLREPLKAPDFVYFVYVVDEQSRKLRGVITLRHLLVSDDDARVEDVMNRYIIALGPLDRATDAAYRVIASHLAALPVTDADGRLIGAVTVDVAVGLVAPLSWSAQAPRVFS